MAKAKKLPSGNWRVQASVTINGEKQIRSFTAPTAAKAERQAAEWQEHYKMIGADSTRLLLKEAIKEYIDINRVRLSPSTIRGYMQVYELGLPDIMDKPLYVLTCPLIQGSVSKAAAYLSPKTIKNRYGLIKSVLAVYYPSFIWTVKYPKMKIEEKREYSDNYIKQIFSALKNSSIEVEAFLGMLSMRASEIGGLKWEDINFQNKTLHIKRVKVLGENSEYNIIDYTKTEKSTRIIYLPDYVIEILKERKRNSNSEFVSTFIPSAYWKKINKILTKNNLEKLRFHELRHIYSSISSKLGIDAQIRMLNGGWSNEKIMDGKYRHPISEAQIEANKKMNNYVDEITSGHTKIHTKKPKRLKLVRFGA